MSTRATGVGPSRFDALSWLPIVGGAAVGAVLLATVIGRLVAAERFVYFWDFSGYWVKTIELGRLLDRPAEALRAVVESVRHDPYNLLAAVPLAPLGRAFGEGRTAWVLSVLGVYGVPALIALGGVVASLSRRGRTGWTRFLSMAPLVLLPALWAPIAAGSVGIGGVAVAGAVWLWGAPPVRQLSPARSAAIGLLLALMVLFRRWYAFWAVGWLIALVTDALAEGSWPERRRALGRVATVGAAAAAVYVAVATPMAWRVLTTDPARELAAYRSPEAPYAQGLALAVAQLGWIPLGLATAGIAIAVHDARTRPLARAMAIQLVAIVLLFLPVQRFDRHHYALVAPQVAVFLGVLVDGLLERGRSRPLWSVGAVVVLASLSVGFVAAFHPPLGDRLRDPWALLATPRYRPRVRDDLASVERLCRTLDALTRGTADEIYVLSSSLLLNDDVLKNAHLSTGAPDLSDRVLRSAHVDRRDGFPHGLLRAAYVVLTDPPGVHLRPREQEVVTIPAREILSGEGIGGSFRRRSETFVLQGGIEARIYERTAPLPPREIRALRDRLEAAGAR